MAGPCRAGNTLCGTCSGVLGVYSNFHRNEASQCIPSTSSHGHDAETHVLCLPNEINAKHTSAQSKGLPSFVAR